MRFNASKCEIMCICRSTQPINNITMYTLGGVALSEVDTAKYLGINISNNLSWSPHINTITGKANAKIGFLWRNLKHCPQQLREQAYIALVRSVLEYGCAVWDPHLRKDISSLEKVQRRAARFVKGDHDWGSSVTKMLADLGWDTLADRRRNIRLALLAKIISGQAAVPTEGLLQEADRRTRSNHPYKFRTIPSQTQAYKNAYFPRTILQWNALSLEQVTLLMPATQAEPAVPELATQDFPPART